MSFCKKKKIYKYFFPSVSSRSSKAHPGPVVHISDNPIDEGKVSENSHSCPFIEKSKMINFSHKGVLRFNSDTKAVIMCVVSERNPFRIT